MNEKWSDMPQELREETLKAAQEMIAADQQPLQLPSAEPEPLPWLDEDGKIDEPLFADDFLQHNPMRCFNGRLFTVDGMIEDETALKGKIFDLIRPYAPRATVKKVSDALQTIKLACACQPPEIQTDRIHVANGTYFPEGQFTEEKEYCMNRLPVAYNPQADAPERWLSFLGGLLYSEDIPTLQEYIGYCLIPSTKAQKMLMLKGRRREIQPGADEISGAGQGGRGNL